MMTWIAKQSSLAVVCVFLLAMNQGAKKEKGGPHSSAITVHVFKTGLFSGFAHNHTIRAPVSRAALDAKGLTAEVVVPARDMKVIDTEVSDSDRAEIQSTMLGPKVLDAEKFPEIRFQSSHIEGGSSGHYTVTGKLDLHGISRSITLEVTREAGHYHGKTRINQTDFGIKPVTVAGGTVKVKNEVELEIDIHEQDTGAGQRH